MPTLSTIRTRGMIASALTFVATIGYFSPLTLSFAALLALFASLFSWTIIRDLAWALHNRLAYRYYSVALVLAILGAVLSSVVLIAVEGSGASVVGYSAGELANVGVLYVTILATDFFVWKSLSEISRSFGTESFRMAGLILLIAAAIPRISYAYYASLTLLAVGYLWQTRAFYSMPREVPAGLQPASVEQADTEPTDMLVGLPLGERYLGGASGPSMTKQSRGYALYATDSRLFGVKEWKSGFGELSAVLNRPQPKQKTIQDLELKHDFVLRKGEISQLELVKPGLLTNGYLLIRRTSGKPIKIRFRGEAEFEQVKDLMDAFFPHAVKMK